MFLFKLKKGRRPDYVFVSCLFILVVFGLVMLSSASSDIGKKNFDDTYHFLKHQIYYGLSFGLIGFFTASWLSYKNWKKFAVWLLIANIILLLLVFTPFGISHKGASRWLNLGPFSVQPAEFLKITFIVYIAAWLSGKKFNRQSSFQEGFVPFISISGLVALLILLQPATTILLIIMSAALIMYFLSGVRLSHIIGIILLGIIVLSLIIYLTPYRYERLMSFFSDESANLKTTNYQVDQSKIAIGSGGLSGVGFGKSTTKYRYLPEPIGDSIFAVIAEEFGFIGSLFLISLFIVLLHRGLSIARNSGDQFAKLMGAGLISIIALQTFIHMAAVSGLMPLTGVPLPFISYGGTALAVFLTMAGVIVNISKHT